MPELLVILVVLAVIGGAMLYRRRAVSQREATAKAELESQLTTSKRAAEEDVTQFGEELQRLDIDVAGHPLDEPMQQDYQRALDAYDNAKTSLDAVTQPDEIKHVTEILEDGRYAVACVKARVAGQPLPAKRPPCFFNPAHGPSSQNVEWAPPGGVRREVPACPADAERVLAGADPYIRTVQVGAQRVPYWEGGQAYAPWAQGYYSRWSGSDMLSGVLIGSLLFGGMGSVFGGYGAGFGGDMGGGGDVGGDAGGDMGGGDMGGGEGFGGFDFGGFGE
jgi:hypothetical protein